MATPTDRQLLIRLASTLPVGSEARRVVLAGCEKLKVPEMREQCEKSKKDGPPAAGKGKSKSKGDDKMPAELLEKFKAKKKAALPKGVQQLLAQLQANPDSTLPLKEATWLGPRRWDHANVLGNLGAYPEREKIPIGKPTLDVGFQSTSFDSPRFQSFYWVR